MAKEELLLHHRTPTTYEIIPRATTKLQSTNTLPLSPRQTKELSQLETHGSLNGAADLAAAGAERVFLTPTGPLTNLKGETVLNSPED